MAIQIGPGISIGPGINIESPAAAPVVLIITEDGLDLQTESGDNLTTE